MYDVVGTPVGLLQDLKPVQSATDSVLLILLLAHHVQPATRDFYGTDLLKPDTSRDTPRDTTLGTL